MTTTQRLPLSVFIPVLNEEDKIAAAIESVAWADEIVVIDTGCTDNTIPIARGLGCRIESLVFEGFGKLRNDAVKLCTHDWVLSIDADERCTPELGREIQGVLAGAEQGEEAFDLYYIPRRNYFMGRHIRHCGWYPDYCQPKLFRKGALVYRDDMVHEGFDIHGRLGYLTSDVLHFSFRNLEQVIDKTNRYSTLGMQKMLQQGKTAGMGTALMRGLWAFFRIYVLKLGFLDGWAGFVIALGNFEGTYYRYAKLALHLKQADSGHTDGSQKDKGQDGAAPRV